MAAALRSLFVGRSATTAAAASTATGRQLANKGSAMHQQQGREAQRHLEKSSVEPKVDSSTGAGAKKEFFQRDSTLGLVLLCIVWYTVGRRHAYANVEFEQKMREEEGELPQDVNSTIA